jgi:hypothetical protein
MEMPLKKLTGRKWQTHLQSENPDNHPQNVTASSISNGSIFLSATDIRIVALKKREVFQSEEMTIFRGFPFISVSSDSKENQDHKNTHRSFACDS